MKITNLGHASFLFETDKVSFVLDPYRDNSVPGLKMPKVKANYVFCSHDHYDHNAKDKVEIIKPTIDLKYDTIIVPHDHHNGTHRGLNKMHIFYIDGLKIIHTGDLGCMPSEEVLEKMKNTDVLLAPINGFYTISAEELFKITNIVNPKVTIPMHYQIKENRSGYPDGGQIDKFKKLVKVYKEIDDYSLEVNDLLFNNKYIIFKKAYQEK